MTLARFELRSIGFVIKVLLTDKKPAKNNFKAKSKIIYGQGKHNMVDTRQPGRKKWRKTDDTEGGLTNDGSDISLSRLSTKLDIDDTLNSTFEISPGESSIFAPTNRTNRSTRGEIKNIFGHSIYFQSTSTPSQKSTKYGKQKVKNVDSHLICEDLSMTTSMRMTRSRINNLNNKENILPSNCDNNSQVFHKTVGEMSAKETTNDFPSYIKPRKKPATMAEKIDYESNVSISVDENTSRLIKSADTPTKVCSSGRVFKKALENMAELKKEKISNKIALNQHSKSLKSKSNQQTLKNGDKASTKMYTDKITEIHQKVFDKMENIQEYQNRKDAKVNRYMTIWGKDKMLNRNTPKKGLGANSQNANYLFKDIPKMDPNFKFMPLNSIEQAKPPSNKKTRNISKRITQLIRNPTINNLPKDPPRMNQNCKFAPFGKIISSISNLQTFKKSVKPSFNENGKDTIASSSQIVPQRSNNSLLSRIPEGSVLKKRLAYDPKSSQSKPTYKIYEGRIKPLTKSPLKSCKHASNIAMRIKTSANVFKSRNKSRHPANDNDKLKKNYLKNIGTMFGM
ncbi:uncharacterized protein LOC135928191 isoform X2 [Gordionus sp. m RMFG-2023]|uniref:uncharacterized protein LOC135928191 isoform X2 n=1 Tax=Gordionus sp. m RMFG-2023 TaxID=3053472 RepID=UPI0031FBBF14